MANGVAIERRRIRVAGFLLKGLRNCEIAIALKVSDAVITQDIKAIRADWRQVRLQTYNHWLEQELAKLEMLEREAWEGWCRSKKEGQAGDPRFLMSVLSFIEKRWKLLGFDNRQEGGAPPERQVVEIVIGDREELKAYESFRSLQNRIGYDPGRN